MKWEAHFVERVCATWKRELEVRDRTDQEEEAQLDEELELDGIASTSAERRMRPELLSRFSLPVVCGLNLDGQCAWVSGRDRAMPQIAPL